MQNERVALLLCCVSLPLRRTSVHVFGASQRARAILIEHLDNRYRRLPPQPRYDAIGRTDLHASNLRNWSPQTSKYRQSRPLLTPAFKFITVQLVDIEDVGVGGLQRFAKEAYQMHTPS